MPAATSKHSREWGLVQSWWILLTFTFLLSWAAFLYIGLRVRRARWTIAGVVYALPIVLNFTADSTVSTAPGHDVTQCAIDATASMPQPIGFSASASPPNGMSRQATSAHGMIQNPVIGTRTAGLPAEAGRPSYVSS